MPINTNSPEDHYDYDSNRNEVPRGLIEETGELVLPENADKQTPYICPHCGDDLVFAKGTQVRPYFRHKIDNPECSIESRIHKTSKIMFLKQLFDHIYNDRRHITFRLSCSRKGCTSGLCQTINIPEKANVIGEEFYDKEKQLGYDASALCNTKLAMVFEVLHSSRVSKNKIQKMDVPWVELKAKKLYEAIESYERDPTGTLLLEAVRGSVDGTDEWICEECVQKDIKELQRIQEEKEEADRVRERENQKILHATEQIRTYCQIQIDKGKPITLQQTCSVPGCNGHNYRTLSTNNASISDDPSLEFNLMLKRNAQLDLGILILRPGIHAGRQINDFIKTQHNWIEANWERPLLEGSSILVDRCRGLSFDRNCPDCEYRRVNELYENINHILRALVKKITQLSHGEEEWNNIIEHHEERIEAIAREIDPHEIDGLQPVDYAAWRVRELVDRLKKDREEADRLRAQRQADMAKELQEALIDERNILFINFENDLSKTNSAHEWSNCLSKYKAKFNTIDEKLSTYDNFVSYAPRMNDVIKRIKDKVNTRKKKESQIKIERALDELLHGLMSSNIDVVNYDQSMTQARKIIGEHSETVELSKNDIEQLLTDTEKKAHGILHHKKKAEAKAKVSLIKSSCRDRISTLLLNSSPYKETINRAIAELVPLFQILNYNDPALDAERYIMDSLEDITSAKERTALEKCYSESDELINTFINDILSAGSPFSDYSKESDEIKNKIALLNEQGAVPDYKFNKLIQAQSYNLQERIANDAVRGWLDKYFKRILDSWKSGGSKQITMEIDACLEELIRVLPADNRITDHPVLELIEAYQAQSQSDAKMKRILNGSY